MRYALTEGKNCQTLLGCHQQLSHMRVISLNTNSFVLHPGAHFSNERLSLIPAVLHPERPARSSISVL